jgi:hypothetical protein
MGRRLEAEGARRFGMNFRLDLVLLRGAVGVQAERAQMEQSHGRGGEGMSCRGAEEQVSFVSRCPDL